MKTRRFFRVFDIPNAGQALAVVSKTMEGENELIFMFTVMEGQSRLHYDYDTIDEAFEALEAITQSDYEHIVEQAMIDIERELMKQASEETAH